MLFDLVLKDDASDWNLNSRIHDFTGVGSVNLAIDRLVRDGEIKVCLRVGIINDLRAAMLNVDRDRLRSAHVMSQPAEGLIGNLGLTVLGEYDRELGRNLAIVVIDIGRADDRSCLSNRGQGEKGSKDHPKVHSKVHLSFHQSISKT
jgi:hypothetical protein